MKPVSDCIGIREYLLRRGLQPHRETATHGMFLSPLREERTPSFSVRYDKGLWYDFGLGEGGTLLQLVMRIEGCGMAEAIRHLRKEAANEVLFQPLPTASPREDSPLRILSVGEIRHPALIGYLRERGIDAVESDLGERIMQLLGLPPRHIVLPAIGVRVQTLGPVWGWTWADPAATTINAVALTIGVVIGASTLKARASKA